MSKPKLVFKCECGGLLERTGEVVEFEKKGGGKLRFHVWACEGCKRHWIWLLEGKEKQIVVDENKEILAYFLYPLRHI